MQSGYKQEKGMAGEMTGQAKPPRWMRLDNAGLIFPAALRRNWSNAFRIAISFADPVDPALLQQALDRVALRFPGICVRLRKSLFWHYLEEVPAPCVRQDADQPLVSMTQRDVRRCAIRILYYRNRIAAEFFHAVTDGTGGMIFTKNLAAEYVRLRYGIEVPCIGDIRDLSEEVPKEELRDSFGDHAGPVAAPRDPRNVFHLSGETEPDRFLHETMGIIDAKGLLAAAHEKGVTVTGYLTAILLKCILDIQYERLGIPDRSDDPDAPIPEREAKRRRKLRPVKVQIPVNLRKLYGGCTMRNFVAVVNIGVDPRMGDYSLEELWKIVHHEMELGITGKNMRAIFTPNVMSERSRMLRIVPLPLKNLVMRMVFDTVGETVACTCLSNLGNVKLPQEMAPYVTRVEFILGPQASAPYNCSVTSWQGKTYLSIVRNSVKPELEARFFRTLVKLGHHVKIENNDRPEHAVRNGKGMHGAAAPCGGTECTV